MRAKGGRQRAYAALTGSVRTQAAAAGLVLNASLQLAMSGAMPTTMAQGNDTYEAWPQRNFEAFFSRARTPDSR